MKEEFSTGVKILIQRMETHPEEFYSDTASRTIISPTIWHPLISSVVATKLNPQILQEGIFFLTDAEADALFEGYKKVRRKMFDDYVMRNILDRKLSSNGKVPYAEVRPRSLYDAKATADLWT